MPARFWVNGRPVELEAPGSMPLLWALRDDLGLTGTKFGCGIGQCGACTVHLEGEPVRSCLTPLDAVTGKKVTTIEGLGAQGLTALQRAWLEEQVPQCGYCQSGQLMSAAALLARKPEPTDSDITAFMSGNLCRCGTYNRIRRAIHRAVELMRQAPGAESRGS